jgi:hypothetical protein
MRPTLAILAIPFAISLAHGAEPKRTADPPNDEAIPVIVDPVRPNRGLSVRCQEVALTGEKQVKVSITVGNLLEEDVFLTVEKIDFEHLKFNGRIFRREVATDVYGGGMGSNHEGLLKRLSGCEYDKAGKPRFYANCFAEISGTLDADTFDPKDVIRAEGKITVPITGYLRANGKSFCKLVDIPVTIVKREKPHH